MLIGHDGFGSKPAARSGAVELIEAGKLTPVVGRTFPLSEVPAAIRYLRDGSPCGKVVITV